MRKSETAMWRWKREHPLVKIGELMVGVYVHNELVGYVRTDNLHCFKRNGESLKYSYKWYEY